MKISRTKKFSYLSLCLLCLSALGTQVNAYTHDMFIGGSDSDNFVLHGHLEYGRVGDNSKTGKTLNGNSEVTQDPLVKYIPGIFGKGHLNKGKELDWLTMSKTQDGKVIVSNTDDVLKEVGQNGEMQFFRPYGDIQYQVEHPQSTSSLSLTEGIQVTTRPVLKSNVNYQGAKLYWTWNDSLKKYEILDYGNKKKNISNIPLKNLGVYRPYFIMGMRSNLLGATGQLNFVLRGKFSGTGKYLDKKVNEYSNGLDAQAFYISNYTYSGGISGEKKSASYLGRSAGMYFTNYLRDGATLENLQKWYRPQLVWSMPLIKINAGKGGNIKYRMNLYDQWTGTNHGLKQITAKGELYSDGKTVFDNRLSSDKYSRDDQGYGETYNGEGYYPKPELIGKGQSENGITWNNQLYRLGSGNNKPGITSKDLTGMMYSYDHRYSYFTDIGFCGDGLMQTFAGEECDDGPGNGEGSCSLTCKNQENTCGNGKVDIVKTKDGKIDLEKSEECDWKMFEGKPVDMNILPTWLKGQTGLTYTGKNNPCYKPEEKDEYSKIVDEHGKQRKACQWKQPYGTIELSPKDGEIKEGSDVRDITLSDLPVWANITTCQWYQLKDANKNYGVNKYKIPNIYEYPYVSYVVLPYLKGGINPNSDQLKKIKGLDGICKLNLYRTDFELRKVNGNKVDIIKDPKKTNLKIIWESIYKNGELNKPKDNDIKVGSQLTNNVAVRFGYSPHRSTINTFINDEPKTKNKINAENLGCGNIQGKEVGNNMYQIFGNFDPDKDTKVSNEMINDINSKFSVRFKSGKEFLVDHPVKNFHKKGLIKLPQISKNETVEIKVKWFNKLENKFKEEICKIELKYQPSSCDMTLSNNGVNNPKVGSNPFDANHGIYSF